MSVQDEVDGISASASQMLGFAQQGARDFMAAGDRRISGLYNAVTCGRSVTFVLQTLRRPLRDEFEGW